MTSKSECTHCGDHNMCCYTSKWGYCKNCCSHPLEDDEAYKNCAKDPEKFIKTLLGITWDIHNASMPRPMGGTNWPRDKWIKYAWDCICKRSCVENLCDACYKNGLLLCECGMS